MDIASYDMIETATETKQLIADSARDFAHGFSLSNHMFSWIGMKRYSTFIFEIKKIAEMNMDIAVDQTTRDETSWFLWFSRNACSRRIWRFGFWLS